MKPIILPSKIDFKQQKEKNRFILTIEPCYPGYGTTLGNALRRVLLSSLPGAAVTAVKIKGAPHEFSTIPGIKEDVLEIILNLKLLRLKIFTEEPVILELKAKGEKVVKAGDIEKNPAVEIVNPDLTIATLTDKKAELEMKIWTSKGRGYEPVEERKEKFSEIGMIGVDALFSPIRKIGLQVENVRVGDRTDYDKLILDIETDGTITAQEAVSQAAKILIDQFNLLIKPEEKVSEKTDKEAEEKPKKEEEPVKTKEVEKEEKPKKKRGRPKKT
jgi:DNA-directed RNA polymerase subunit alpha